MTAPITSPSQNYQTAEPTLKENPEPTLKENPELALRLQTILDSSGAIDISASVYNAITAEVFTFHPEYIGLEASIVKVPLALCAMKQAKEAGGRLLPEYLNLVTQSIRYSDNESARAIYNSLGPTVPDRLEALNSMYTQMGISENFATRGWGQNLTTVENQIKILRCLDTRPRWADSKDLEVLLDAMRVGDAFSQGWGVGLLSNINNKIDLYPGVSVADEVFCKNGWLSDVTGLWYVNSDGIARFGDEKLLISVMTAGFDSAEPGKDLCNQIVAEIAQAYT